MASSERRYGESEVVHQGMVWFAVNAVDMVLLIDRVTVPNQASRPFLSQTRTPMVSPLA